VKRREFAKIAFGAIVSPLALVSTRRPFIEYFGGDEVKALLWLLGELRSHPSFNFRNGDQPFVYRNVTPGCLYVVHEKWLSPVSLVCQWERIYRFPISSRVSSLDEALEMVIAGLASAEKRRKP